MGMRLFVGGLNYKTTEEGLRDHFEADGDIAVQECIVMKDRITGHSRGFGFVTLETIHDEPAVIGRYNGQRLDGRALTVNHADEKPVRQGGGGGGRDHRDHGFRDGRERRAAHHRS